MRGAGEAAMDALREIERLEGLLSIYREGSDLSRANREAAWGPVKVEASTMEMLEGAREMYHRSGGAYDVTTASLSECWGFSRREGRMPSEEEIRVALSHTGTPWMELDIERRLVAFAKPGLQVNPGGIGKGFALDCGARFLREAGVERALLHGGQSSCLAWGNQEEGMEGWRIAVRHPIHTEMLLGEIWLRDAALGTSGAAKQFFYHRGKRYSHVLDPRTGWPAKHWLSVTVVTERAMNADALATAAFVMGREELAAFASREPSVGIVAIGEGERDGGAEIVVWNLDDKVWRQLLPD